MTTTSKRYFMSLFENGEAYINYMDKAQSNGTVSAFSWSDAGKEAFYIQNSLLELASIGQILWKVLTVMLLWW